LAAFHDKIERIALKNERYPDASQTHLFWYNSELHEKSNLLKSELARIWTQHPAETGGERLTNNRIIEEWYAALNNFSNWLREKKQYISNKQRELESL
jgi:hypothetical protein